MSDAQPIQRILVIDDNPAIHHDFKKVLCGFGAPAELERLEAALFDGSTDAAAAMPQFEINSAMQGMQGVEMLHHSLAEGRPYPMAFVDMRMPPGLDGVQTIRELWKVDKRLQVVICTAYSDYSPDQIAAALGVSDQMLIMRKPFEAAEIRQLANTLCAKWRSRYERQELEKIVETRTAELKHAALHDSLTGLPNRVLFNDRLGMALRRAQREKDYRFAVLFTDCDRFKVINDSLGHGAGDELLLEIAKRLETCVRDVDTITATNEAIAARFGGDEFCVILDRLREDADAARVAQRILNALSQPYTLNGQQVHSGVSIGITTSSVGYETAGDMLRDADIAMYRAKKAGGSAFVMFDPKMHVEAVNILTVENDLRRAVAQNQIVVHYQPIMDMRTDRLLGFEALCRWNHPTRGQVQPNDFVPQAEQTGVIMALGVYVLEQACAQLARWQNDYPAMANLTMSVNVSRKQLDSLDFTKHLARILQHSGIKPQNLNLEITETSISDDSTRAVQVLQQIQEMHVKLQVDDFGTGYSSLSSLLNVPLAGLKIDRQFINALGNADSAALVKTVVSLAHNLKVPLVAEGIETMEQHAALQAMGCDRAQGYLFSKPMDAPNAEDFIRNHLSAKASTAA